MKKLSLLFVLCIMILALVGCGGGGGESQHTTIPANGGDVQEPSDDLDNPERPNVIAMLHLLDEGISNNDITKTVDTFSNPAVAWFIWNERDITNKSTSQLTDYFSGLFTNRPFRSYQFMNYSMIFSGTNVTVDADVYFTEYTSSAKTSYSENKYSVEIKAVKSDSGWKITSYMCTAPQY